MSEDQSDAQLIAACIKREAWAWDALIERYQRLVYSIPLRAGLSRDDAADVFQTVFTRLLANLRAIRDPQGLAKWLITTAKRESWALSRKQQREPADSAAVDQARGKDAWMVDAHPHEDLWAEQALVRHALDQLGERCRTLLTLLYYDQDEPSYEEIGARLQMPLGSIGPTRARCLQKLRSILQAIGVTW